MRGCREGAHARPSPQLHFGGQGGEPTPCRTGPAQHWETLLVSGRGSSPTPDRALREAFHVVTRAERCYRCDCVQPQWPGTSGAGPHCARSRLHFRAAEWCHWKLKGLATRPAQGLSAWAVALGDSDIKRSICLKFPLSRVLVGWWDHRSLGWRA